MSILKISRYAHYTLVFSLVAAAVLLTFVRVWLLPRGSEWRDELRATISSMIGEQVEIKSLTAEMRGFKPELMVRGFRIENAAHDGPPLEFERLGVGLDLLGSLLSGKPVVNRIDLVGAKIRLSRRPDGGLGVAGLKPGDIPLWLFAEGEVRLADMDLEWDGGGDGPAMPLGRAQMRLRNGVERHTLDVKLDLPGKLGKLVKLSAEIDGNPLRSDAWKGRAYLEAKRLREGAFNESLPVRLHSGEAGVQAWAEWSSGALSGVAARLDLDRPVFTWRGSEGTDGMMGLEKLAGWLFWRKENDGWRLDVKNLNLSQKGRAWPETDFSIAIGTAADNSLQSLRLAVNFLRFDDVQILVGGGLPLLEGDIRETFRAYLPKGEVRNGKLVYQSDGHIGFCGELTGFAFTPPVGWPVFDRMDGRLCGNDRNGKIEFNTVNLQLNLPSLWQNPFTVNKLAGSLKWFRTGGGGVPPLHALAEGTRLFAGSTWQIAANQIEVEAPGLQATAGFALDLPSDEGKSPVLDMIMQMREVDAVRLRNYLPLAAMSPNVSKWLGEAFDGGKLKTADVLFRGRLAEFPFRQGEGLFQAQVDAENMEFEFNPDWPHLYDVKTKILFFGPALFIDAEAGRIGNLPFHAVHAEAADYISNGWLSLSGSLDNDFATGMKFLRQTPIRHIPERVSKLAEPTGPFHLDLNLLVSMNYGQGGVGFGGLLQLNNDSLALKDVNLKVQEITGALSFSGAGMEGKQILAKVLDEPVVFDVGQQNGDILLDLLGKAGVPALRQSFPGRFWNHADGSFAYHLNLKVPDSLNSSSKPIRIELDSDLAGLGLKLPAPLVKAAADKKDFTADLFVHRDDNFSLRWAYGHEGQGRLAFSNGLHLDSGDIAWGKPLPQASGEPGLGIYLKMDSLDLGEWHSLLGGLGSSLFKSIPRSLDIELKSLTWRGEDLGPLWLTGKQENAELLGEVDNYYGKGSYSAAITEISQSLLRLDLERLNLPKFMDAREGQSSALVDPASLPSLQIRTRHLLHEGVDFGELAMETEHWTAGLNFKNLRISANNHEIGLRGTWSRLDGHDETKLSGNLRVQDLDRFLSMLGYPNEIYRTPTEAAFSLSWIGSPHQFSLASSEGDIRLNMGRGRVSPLDLGLGRALPMLNLQTLRRLLLVNFSDLFGKGLAYDGMEGVFELVGGKARTKAFLVNAVAAEILMMGWVGLANHDLDQTISVLPNRRTTAPPAGMGAVIDFANRLAGAEEPPMTTTNYSVTGNWDNPQFKHIEGRVPLEMIEQTWSEIKSISGAGKQGDNISE